MENFYSCKKYLAGMENFDELYGSINRAKKNNMAQVKETATIPFTSQELAKIERVKRIKRRAQEIAAPIKAEIAASRQQRQNSLVK